MNATGVVKGSACAQRKSIPCGCVKVFGALKLFVEITLFGSVIKMCLVGGGVSGKAWHQLAA